MTNQLEHGENGGFVLHECVQGRQRREQLLEVIQEGKLLQIQKISLIHTFSARPMGQTLIIVRKSCGMTELFIEMRILVREASRFVYLQIEYLDFKKMVNKEMWRYKIWEKYMYWV